MTPLARLYLISPPAIDLPVFTEKLKDAFSGGDIGSFQLRLKNAGDDEILKAAEVLIPICHEHDAAFIMNDRPDLAVTSGADGVHIGQDDLSSFPSPPEGEGQGEGYGAKRQEKDPPHLGLPKDLLRTQVQGKPSSPSRGEGKNRIAAIRKIVGENSIIGISCHDSRHLAMEAGEQGADYVAFGAFYPTTSKSPEALAKYGTPKPDILTWWQEFMVLPCVAIGGINPGNCGALVKAGADFIAVITAVWNHQSPGEAVEEFNKVIQQNGR